MEENVGLVLAMVVVLAFLGVYMYFHITRSKELVQKWADENGYELLSANFSMFFKGPYFWSSRSQVVYRVGVRDAQGIERSGWVRCGSWFAGVFSDKVEGVLDV